MNIKLRSERSKRYAPGQRRHWKEQEASSGAPIQGVGDREEEKSAKLK